MERAHPAEVAAARSQAASEREGNRANGAVPERRTIGDRITTRGAAAIVASRGGHGSQRMSAQPWSVPVLEVMWSSSESAQTPLAGWPFAGSGASGL